MKILVTGGAGLIGSHIVDLSIAAGHDVAVIDNLWARGGGKVANIHSDAHFFQVDVTDKEAVAQVFDDFKPDIVSHQAAQHDVLLSTQQPEFDAHVNIMGLLNILTNCSRLRIHKIILASSGSTYGSPNELPINEETPQYPESPYGITKMAAEQYLRYWQKEYGLPYTILRYGNVYGPRQDPNGEAGVIAIFIKCFRAHATIRIDWDGEQRKDYIYVEDVARANVMAFTRGDNETFCIGNDQPVSVNEIYDTLVKMIGYEPKIIHAPKRPGDVYLSYFDCTKAERILHWKPLVGFAEGVRATIEHFKSQ